MEEDGMMEVMMIGGPFDGQIYELAPSSSIVIPLTTTTSVKVPIRADDGRYVAVWDERMEKVG